MKILVYTKDMTKATSRAKVIDPNDQGIEDTIDLIRFEVESLINEHDVKIDKDYIVFDRDESGDDIFSEEILSIKKGEDLNNTFFYQEMRKALINN